jgi:hypothetical protein
MFDHIDKTIGPGRVEIRTGIAAVSGLGARIGHYGHKIGLVIANRQAQATPFGCSEPGEQMWRKHVMPARDLRHHRSRAQRLDDNPFLFGVALAPPLPNSRPDFYTVGTKAFGYSFEHIYKMIPPIQPRIFARQLSACNVGSAHRYRCRSIIITSSPSLITGSSMPPTAGVSVIR